MIKPKKCGVAITFDRSICDSDKASDGIYRAIVSVMPAVNTANNNVDTLTWLNRFNRSNFQFEPKHSHELIKFKQKKNGFCNDIEVKCLCGSIC